MGAAYSVVDIKQSVRLGAHSVNQGKEKTTDEHVCTTSKQIELASLDSLGLDAHSIVFDTEIFRWFLASL